MSYKGYVARVEFSAEDECFVGHLAGIRDIVGFHGQSVAELRAAFHEAVDDYLASCENLGIAPNSTYSRQFRLRLQPELHAKAAIADQAHGKSLNAWVTEAIEKVFPSNYLTFQLDGLKLSIAAAFVFLGLSTSSMIQNQGVVQGVPQLGFKLTAGINIERY